MQIKNSFRFIHPRMTTIITNRIPFFTTLNNVWVRTF